MTPLEEIEQAIQRAKELQFNEGSKLAIIGTLYQARAIERLETAVRTIGVKLQRPATVRGPRDTHEYAPYAPEFTGSPCRCGNPRIHPIHPAEFIDPGRKEPAE